MSADLLRAAHQLAAVHHRQYDPSHDLHHIHRVLALALQIAHSLPTPPDLLILQLAALFHDLLDSKYLPKGAAPLSAAERLHDFWLVYGEGVSEPRRRLVERVVENVSYSKEVKRVARGEQTAWHEGCVELHCVQDADKLDAIGAFGVLRCAAYSGATGVELYNPATPSATGHLHGGKAKSSAVDHFHEKLFELEGMMKTAKGRELAASRAAFMRQFVEQVEREAAEAPLPDFLA